MAKKFKNTTDGTITVSAQGRSPVTLEPDEDFETEDEELIAALEANPDVEESKGAVKKAVDKVKGEDK